MPMNFRFRPGAVLQVDYDFMIRHPHIFVWLLFASILVGVDAHAETCQRIILELAIRQYFVESLRTSGTKFKMDGPELVCFADSDTARVEALSMQAYAARPQQCWNFDDRKRLQPLLNRLRAEGIPSWMEKFEGPVCYLERDQRRVASIVASMPK